MDIVHNLIVGYLLTSFFFAHSLQSCGTSKTLIFLLRVLLSLTLNQSLYGFVLCLFPLTNRSTFSASSSRQVYSARSCAAISCRPCRYLWYGSRHLRNLFRFAKMGFAQHRRLEQRDKTPYLNENACAIILSMAQENEKNKPDAFDNQNISGTQNSEKRGNYQARGIEIN